MVVSPLENISGARNVLYQHLNLSYTGVSRLVLPALNDSGSPDLKVDSLWCLCSNTLLLQTHRPATERIFLKLKMPRGVLSPLLHAVS